MADPYVRKILRLVDKSLVLGVKEGDLLSPLPGVRERYDRLQRLRAAQRRARKRMRWMRGSTL